MFLSICFPQDRGPGIREEDNVIHMNAGMMEHLSGLLRVPDGDSAVVI